MKFRLLAFLPFILAACTTPAPKPLPPVAQVIDDDHRSVSREEFKNSKWAPLPGAASWIGTPTGVAVTLTDGRVLRLEFAGPSVVRWWVPAAAGDAPFSLAAVYPTLSGFSVKTKEVEGTVFLDTPGLGVRLRLSDLSWTMVRGDKTVIATSGGPSATGRRMLQAFGAEAADRWFGVGLNANSASAKYWAGNTDADTAGPFATPGLFGAGGNLPIAMVLDNSYQTYSSITPETVSLGALNGGLDLLIAAAPQAAAVVEALSGLTGRPSLPPLWAHGTALVLPDEETGAFIRKAKLSIQTAVGSATQSRQRFQNLAELAVTAVPDLTSAETRAHWLTSLAISDKLPSSGLTLPALPGRDDWNARFEDGGLASPLARMNNRLPVLAAQALDAEWAVRNPGLRPFLLSSSTAWGTIRSAFPELRVVAGHDAEALAQVLVQGALGLGTPAIRLDLTPLASAETRVAAYQSLLCWILNPVLILDWGPNPAGFWTSLSDLDRQRLKTILDRRSQLKPLLDQGARQAALSGRPVWQPLWFASADSKSLVSDDEFLFGDLLAAPVLEGTSRSVYLPGPGVWFNFWSGEEFGGGRSYELEASPDKPLLFVRGGAFVPVRDTETFDERDIYNPLTVHVFPGGRGVGTYYLDDGKTLGWRSGAAWESKLVYDFTQNNMSIEHVAVSSTGAFKPDPYILYRIHNVFKPRGVTIDRKVVPLYGDSWGITDTDRNAAWYESDHTLLVKVFKPEMEQKIVMTF